MRKNLVCLLFLPLLLGACGGQEEEKVVSTPRAVTAATMRRPAPTPIPEVGLFNFKENGKWGYRNWEKRNIIPPTFDRAEGFFEGLAAVMVDGKWGFIDSTGELVIPATYDWAMYFSEGLAPVKLGGKWGYINRQGEMVIEPAFSLANDFTDGRAQIELDGVMGYIDQAGNPVE